MNDHSASRRLDVLQEQAPHLIAQLSRTAESVQRLAATLHETVAAMREAHRRSEVIPDELWTVADRLAGELAERLGDLERERRSAAS